MNNKKITNVILSALLSTAICFGVQSTFTQQVYAQADLAQIPAYTGSPYTILEENIPEFTEEDMHKDSFEIYSDLDNLGRCGVAYANIGHDIMPNKKRGKIGQVKPAGWHTVKYPNIITDGMYLYNRCHLVGYQLAGENANEKNLITGTRYMNVEGMLPFENEVSDYVEETGNHVLYRVTPLYQDDNLLCHGVQMEAKSVEDNGSGVMFNVFCYNVQPGITIDYKTGDSEVGGIQPDTAGQENEYTADKLADNNISVASEYVININTKKLHCPDCKSVQRMSEKNKQYVKDSKNNLIEQGYKPCEKCNP